VPKTGWVEPLGVITAWSPVLIRPTWASVTEAWTLKVPGEMRTIAGVPEPVEPEEPDELEEPEEPAEPVAPDEPDEPDAPVEPEDPEPDPVAPDDEDPDPPDELPDEPELLPLEPPPETDWPVVMLTAPIVPAKGVTMLAAPELVWACDSCAYADACCDWAWAIDA